MRIILSLFIFCVFGCNISINPSFEKLSTDEKQEIMLKFENENSQNKFKFINIYLLDSLLINSNYKYAVIGNTTCPGFFKLSRDTNIINENCLIIDNTDLYYYSEYSQKFQKEFLTNCYYMNDTTGLHYYLKTTPHKIDTLNHSIIIAK